MAAAGPEKPKDEKTAAIEAELKTEDDLKKLADSNLSEAAKQKLTKVDATETTIHKLGLELEEGKPAEVTEQLKLAMQTLHKKGDRSAAEEEKHAKTISILDLTRKIWTAGGRTTSFNKLRADVAKDPARWEKESDWAGLVKSMV